MKNMVSNYQLRLVKILILTLISYLLLQFQFLFALDKVYWVNQRDKKIQRSNLDGSKMESIITSGLDRPYGLAIDPLNGKIYWTDWGLDRIKMANLDGSGVTTIISSGLGTPLYIVVDPQGGKVYWTDSNKKTINRSNLDGSNSEAIVSGLKESPCGIDLDISGGKVYWSAYGPGTAEGVIQRANLNGSQVETITSAIDPNGLALDVTHNKMYWVNNGFVSGGYYVPAPQIWWSDLNGSNKKKFLSKGTGDTFLPKDLAIDFNSGKIYWTEAVSSGWEKGYEKIMRANLNGTNVEALITDIPGDPTPIGIALLLNYTPSGIIANFTASPLSGTAPLTVQFTDQSTGNITSRSWDFGDGQTSTSKNPSHAYQNAGAYTVKLTVTGPGGSNTKTRTNYIIIKSQPGESKFIEIASDSPGDALNSLPRDVYAGCDLDKDGKKEILVTNYTDGGKVHVFEVIGDNKIELVWSSKGTSSTNQYTARSVKIGDLDNNGLQEILVPMARSGNPNDHGLHVFEWDGKSDNGYGNGLPISTFKVAQNWESGSTETIAVGDIDNDGKQEVVYPNNGDGSDDCVFIISCDGKFSQKNIRWKIEAEFKRADGYFGGSPNSSVIGDLDKDGHKEAIIGIWDYAAFLILESTGPDNFVKRAYVKTNPDLDDVCYKTIVIDDFDNDNRDDIIFTLRDSNKIGVVHQISSLENLTNNPLISYIYTSEIGQLYSLAYSDQDNDGEPNIFATQYKNGGILNIQYDGSGDRLSSLNYVGQQLFIDETGNSEGSFAISAPDVDLDGDNLKEVIVTFLEAKGTSAKWLRVFEHNGGKSGVNKWQVITPEDYILNQNYPNPFNSSTEISFKLPTYKNITLEIFDITGKLTKTLIGNQTISEGYHRISWDGTNNNGENVPSGVYVYRLSYGNFSTSKRLALVK